MKIAYLMHNPGIESVTPEGWESALVSSQPDGTYTEDDMRQLVDADILVVGLEPVPEAVFERAEKLKLVQRLGVGHENIDLEAASRHNVPVCYMPDFNAETVAEHTLMLILALLRRVFESTLLMKATQWPILTVTAKGIFDLQGKSLGLVGMGAIGQAVAKRARPFEVELRYFDQRRLGPPEEAALGVSYLPLDRLLEASDIVSIHLPLTPKTRHLIGKEELRRMKPSALLINTARGAIVDEEALAQALEEGVIAGAGLDVFAEEPLDPRHPLRRCQNVLLTPHSAGQTREAMDRMVRAMLENIHRVARGEEPLYRVTPP